MKNKVLEFIFRSYTRDIKSRAEEASELKFEAYKRTLDIKDLIRERFKGIRINRPDDSSILENKLASLEDDNSRLAFLSKAYDVIKNNETFKIVCESALVELAPKALLESNDMVDVNFNRASVNGIMIVEDQLERLSSMYIMEREQNKPLSEEEKHAIIS